MKQAISALLLCVSGAGVGAAIMDATRKADPPRMEYNYVFYSDVRGEKQISIKSNGETEIGPHYDLTAEARKLFEMVKRMQDDGATADCHETGYHSPYWSRPDQGMAQVFPGPANPPPPRMEWHF